jgi:hypothetical protein
MECSTLRWNFETEGPLGESNLYVSTTMKTGIVYNADGSEINDFNTGIEIPGLIQTEIGFLKY